MNTNERKLLELISKGERIDLEFKTCRNQLNRDIYETVCAFLNRHGGTIILGITDSGQVEGIDPDAVNRIKKDFVTAINNPQKIYPPAYLSVDEAEVKGKKLLRIYVPESSQVHRCNGRIHDRLRSDLIEKCRRLAGVWRDDHPWLGMDDLELLKSAQLYQTDPETGRSGITLAGILLLGNDQLILSAVPHHRTDLILRKVNLDRYDDRDLVRINLIESYDRIIAFVQKHLPDPFFLEGMERISIRDAIFREVASNILIHREYTNAFPAKLIIERGQVRTENSNKPHGFGVLDPTNFTPFPKNPVIGAFFREIHRADELGSGMRKMMRYGKIYGGADPEMIEGDVFRIIVKVPEFSATGEGSVTPEVADEVDSGAQSWAQWEAQSWAQSAGIVRALGAGPLSAADLVDQLGLKSKTGAFKRSLQELLDKGLAEYTIPDKPNSRLQKYRLTEKGRNLLATRQGGDE